MAKIIKVGSQNPTFTSAKTKKASSIQTHRNSNEATNPFKFTNFEGNTLQFADVFEGFKPSFKASSANKLRMIASTATGSMSKIKSLIPESIVNFAKRVAGGISHAWEYASNTSFTAAISDAKNAIKEVPAIKQTTEFLLAERHLPEIYNLSSHLTALKEGLSTRMESLHEIGKGVSSRCKDLVSNISFSGRQKYANMSVADIELAWKNINALAEGGINE